jgi:hypothetical protein
MDSTTSIHDSDIDDELPKKITHMPYGNGYNDISIVKLKRYIKHAEEKKKQEN